MVRSALFIVLGLALAGCDQKSEAPLKRATVQRTGGTTFEIVPSAGQMPFCLVYTVSRSGLTRQLTMSRSNQSFECPASAWQNSCAN